jgi:hypothetical protein
MTTTVCQMRKWHRPCRPGTLTPYNTLSSTNQPMTYAQITASELTASQARSAIYDLADLYSWETIATEMISRMSGDEAREFVDDFIRLYAD